MSDGSLITVKVKLKLALSLNADTRFAMSIFNLTVTKKKRHTGFS